MAKVELVTIKDLERLKETLIEELKRVLKPVSEKPKKWLKSAEVRQLLKLSPGSLQNLRIKGILHPKKIGGTYYYNADEVEGLFR